MSHRRRENCIDPESNPLFRSYKKRQMERPQTSKQLSRLACSEADSTILRKQEADEAATKDNVELFLRAFSPARLSAMEPEDYAIFKNPEYNDSLPKVFIVYALTHLEHGSIADYILEEDDVKDYLEQFPGHGAIELGVSVEPDDNGGIDVSATLLQELNTVREAGFSNRAMGVVKNTENRINQLNQ